MAGRIHKWHKSPDGKLRICAASQKCKYSLPDSEHQFITTAEAHELNNKEEEATARKEAEVAGNVFGTVSKKKLSLTERVAINVRLVEVVDNLSYGTTDISQINTESLSKLYYSYLTATDNVPPDEITARQMQKDLEIAANNEPVDENQYNAFIQKKFDREFDREFSGSTFGDIPDAEIYRRAHKHFELDLIREGNDRKYLLSKTDGNVIIPFQYVRNAVDWTRASGEEYNSKTFGNVMIAGEQKITQQLLNDLERKDIVLIKNEDGSISAQDFRDRLCDIDEYYDSEKFQKVHISTYTDTTLFQYSLMSEHDLVERLDLLVHNPKQARQKLFGN